MHVKNQDSNKKMGSTKNEDLLCQSNIQLNSAESILHKINRRKFSSDKKLNLKNIKVNLYNEKVLKTEEHESDGSSDKSSTERNSFDNRLYNEQGDNKFILHLRAEGFEETANEIAMLDQIKLGVSEYFNKPTPSKTHSRRSATPNKSHREVSVGFSSLSNSNSKRSKSKPIIEIDNNSNEKPHKKERVNIYKDKITAKGAFYTENSPQNIFRVKNQKKNNPALRNFKLPKLKKKIGNEKLFFETNIFRRKSSVQSENIDSRQNTERFNEQPKFFERKISLPQDFNDSTVLESPNNQKNDGKVKNFSVHLNSGISQIEEDMRSVLDTIATNLRKNDENLSESSDKSENSNANKNSPIKNNKFMLTERSKQDLSENHKLKKSQSTRIHKQRFNKTILQDVTIKSETFLRNKQSSNNKIVKKNENVKSKIDLKSICVYGACLIVFTLWLAFYLDPTFFNENITHKNFDKKIKKKSIIYCKKGTKCHSKWQLPRFVQYKDVYFKDKVEKVTTIPKKFDLDLENASIFENLKFWQQTDYKNQYYISIYFKENDSLLYTGPITSQGNKPHGSGVNVFQKNSKKAFSGDLYYGLKEGYGIEYYTDESIKYQGFYKNDKKHCASENYRDNVKNCRLFYKKDVLKYEGGFHLGKYHGFGRLYHSNGKIHIEGHFINGVLSDDLQKCAESKIWDRNGNLKMKGKFYNGMQVNGKKITQNKDANKKVINVFEDQ